jgi:hypothetical protein
MEELVGFIKELGLGEIATVVGRYYAMDRDKRWERLEIALKGLVLGEGEASEDPVATVKKLYETEGKNNRDEFLLPIIVGGDERRIKGKFFEKLLSDGNMTRLISVNQMMIPSSSSTTDPIVHDKSLSCSAMLIDPCCPTFPTPRSTSSSP